MSIKILSVIWVVFLVSTHPMITMAGNVNSMIDEQSSKTYTIKEIDLGEYRDEMIVGERQLLSITLIPVHIENPNIEFLSSQPDIATINGLGRITAVRAGETRITVKCGNMVESFLLRIKNKEPADVPTKEIKVDDYDEKLKKGKSLKLNVTVYPEDSTDKIGFSSNDEDIATVNGYGEVTGIKTGRTIIYAKAGTIVKEIPIRVYVPTEKISVATDYLVLKVGETYNLDARVMPDEAEQTIRYLSMNPDVASVSDNGIVQSVSNGSTSIVIDNGDKTVAITIIVNLDIEHSYNEPTDTSTHESGESLQNMSTIYANDTKIVGTEILKRIYEEKSVLKVIGDGYILYIDGKKIRNYNNSLYTDISLQQEVSEMSFLLNQGKPLCGEIRLSIDSIKGGYLHLKSEDKLEYIKVDDISDIVLSAEGMYYITENKRTNATDIVKYVLIIGALSIVIVLCIYIYVKRKYWFW